MLEKTTDVGEDLHLAKDEIITSMMNRRHLYEDKLSIDEAVKTTVSEAEAKGDLVFQVLNWYGTDLDDDVIGEEEEDDDEGGGGDPKKKRVCDQDVWRHAQGRIYFRDSQGMFAALLR
jgi:hypothetical protein